MNKKEIREIRKVMKPDNPYCVINSIHIAVIDADEECRSKQKISPLLMNDYEQNMIYKILRSVVSTKLCKKFTEYDFNVEDGVTVGAQKDLLVIREQKLSDTAFDLLCDDIRDHCIYPGPYAIVAASLTYSALYRNAAGEDEKFRTEDFNFIITAICPAHTIDAGFSFNNATNEFSTETDKKLYIAPNPVDGFMFPSYSDRTADVNSVMYYCKNPKNPNLRFIEDFLGCSFTLTAESESAYFKQILENTYQGDLTYSVLYLVNDLLTDWFDTFKDDSKPPMVGKSDISLALRLSGERLESFNKAWDFILNGVSELHLENLIESKIKIQTSDYTISFKPEFNLLSTNASEGAKNIKLGTTDSCYDVNGILIDF